MAPRSAGWGVTLWLSSTQWSGTWKTSGCCHRSSASSSTLRIPIAAYWCTVNLCRRSSWGHAGAGLVSCISERCLLHCSSHVALWAQEAVTKNRHWRKPKPAFCGLNPRKAQTWSVSQGCCFHRGQFGLPRKAGGRRSNAGHWAGSREPLPATPAAPSRPASPSSAAPQPDLPCSCLSSAAVGIPPGPCRSLPHLLHKHLSRFAADNSCTLTGRDPLPASLVMGCCHRALCWLPRSEERVCPPR